MLFKKVFLQCVVANTSDSAELIKDIKTGGYQYVEHHQIIFKFNNKFYRSFYNVEKCGGYPEPYEDYEDELTCVEVEPFETSVTDYRRVEEYQS